MIKSGVLGDKTNRLMLFLALFFGVVSALLVYVYLSQAKEEGGGGTGSGALVPVVVAARDIQAGTRLTADMVSIKKLSQGAVLTGAFQKTEDVIGKVTRVPLVAGEQVIPAKVTGGELALAEFGDNPPLSLVVPEGMRAVSIEVNSVVGAGGLIRPGDRVDVILSVAADVLDDQQETIGRNQIARTILQDVQVLAVGEDVVRMTTDSEGAQGEQLAGVEEANPEATTVTLAVSPVHGEVLTVADECRERFAGRISLALRGFGDSSPVSARSQWPADGPPPDCASLLGLPFLP